MNAKKVTTSVSYEEYKLIQENAWKPSDLIRLGIACKVKPDVLHEKLIGLQNQVKALEIKLHSKTSNLNRFMPPNPEERKNFLHRMMGGNKNEIR